MKEFLYKHGNVRQAKYFEEHTMNPEGNLKPKK